MPGYSWGTTKPPSGTPVNRSHPLAQGLIGSWLMSEGAGSLLVDSAGNSPGIIEAGPTWQGGRFGAALKFDTSHKASVSNTSPLNVALTTSRVTVEAYAFYTSGTNQGLVDLTNAGSTNLGYQLFLENTPAVAKFRVNKSGGSDTLTSTVTVTTGWHQFVATYDLTTYVVYVDGVATTTVKPSNTLVSASGPLLIGKLGSAVYPFAGQISHVRIWNRPLAQAEINQLRAEPFAMYAPPVWRRYFIPIPPNPSTLAGSLASATGSFTATQSITATLAGSLASATGSLTAAETITGSLAGSEASPTGSVAATETETSTLAGSQDAATGSFTAAETIPSALDGTLASPTGSFTVVETITSTLSGSLPAPTASFTAEQAESHGGWWEDQRSGSRQQDEPTPQRYGRPRRATQTPKPQPQLEPVIIACSLRGTLARPVAKLHSAAVIHAALHGRLRRPTARYTATETIHAAISLGTLKSASGAMLMDQGIETVLDGSLNGAVPLPRQMAEMFEPRLSALERDQADLEALLVLR